MISPKHLAGLLMSSLLIVSCTPAYPPGHRPDAPPMNPAIGPDGDQSNQKTIAQLERELAERKAEEKRRKEAKAREMEANAGNNAGSPDAPRVTNNDTTTPPPAKPNNNQKKTYRTARAIPGKAGYVFNPWTLEPVDVRGIPSGSLVQDPNDPNKANHRFRVP